MFGLGNKTPSQKELSITNLIDEIGKLECENELLTEKVHEQDELLSSITQENALMSDRIEVLEGDIEEYEKIGKELGLRNQLRDYYNEGLLQMALEKTTDQREIYKKTIKKMCENFNINHNDVCKIIDDIKNDKSQQREL